MKKRSRSDPFANLILDEEEKQIEQALGKGEYQENPNFEETKKMLQEAASRYLELNKSKSITIRINQLDLIKIKAKAKRKQIPYQTLVGALLHEFAEEEKQINLK